MKSLEMIFFSLIFYLKLHLHDLAVSEESDTALINDICLSFRFKHVFKLLKINFLRQVVNFFLMRFETLLLLFIDLCNNGVT